MVRRDRRHPSVLWWSLCNENNCHTNNTEGAALAQLYIGAMHAVDPMHRAISGNQKGERPWNFEGGMSPLVDAWGSRMGCQLMRTAGTLPTQRSPSLTPSPRA